MNLDWSDLDERATRAKLYRGLALGFLAMVPLLVAYEMGVARFEYASRNTSERLLFYVLRPLGAHQDIARRLALAVATVATFVYCLRRHWGLGPLLARTVLEGLLAALFFGPAALFLVRIIGPEGADLPRLTLEPGSADLSSILLVTGSAAHEELLSRVCVFGAAHFLTAWLLVTLGFAGPTGRLLTELTAIAASALVFAALSLNACVGWLDGMPGEEFHPAVFAYRVSAGVLFALLFRWRGPGVAAWTHALFNLGLMLGVGPDVFG